MKGIPSMFFFQKLKQFSTIPAFHVGDVAPDEIVYIIPTIIIYRGDNDIVAI